jgi:hypothetical protein
VDGPTLGGLLQTMVDVDRDRRLRFKHIAGLTGDVEQHGRVEAAAEAHREAGLAVCQAFRLKGGEDGAEQRGSAQPSVSLKRP